MDKKTVLFVDDEAILLKSAGIYFKDKFNFLKAANGVEAWEVLKNWEVDCVVTDINMPLMSGIELLEKMRSERNNTSVIVVTGNYDDQTIKRCRELGVKDLIYKPYLIKDLIQKINSLTS